MNSLITEPLGLYGWQRFDPVILAALTTKLPMLLVGKHGCAKSFVLERLAESLNLEYRLYNASLINYDDLVGIPIPTDDKKALTYITNPTSIWDAQVVFIDEINRTKPELQNKLFPIIYEKRVQGTNLDKLEYRWAAMNPPHDEYEDEYYGAMPLDAALADRFPFILRVPSYSDLSEDDIQNMLIDQYKGKHNFPIDIHSLIKETEKEYKKVIEKYEKQAIKYIEALVGQLSNSIGYISPRRATMLENTLLAIHASRVVINRHTTNEEVDFRDSCIIAVKSTVPDIASKDIKESMLVAIASQAYQISVLDDCASKRMLLINDNTERIIYALKNQEEIDSKVLGETITSSIAKLNIKQRRAASLISYLALRKSREIAASVIETLTLEAKPCFTVSENQSFEVLKKSNFYHVITTLGEEEKDKTMILHRQNLLNSFMPDKYTNEKEIEDLAKYFEDMWDRVNE